MAQLKKIGKYFLIFAFVAFLALVLTQLFGPRIGNTFSTIQGSLPSDSTVVAPTSIGMPTSELPAPGDEEPFAEIDSLLKQSIHASIAYNAPAEMQLNETATIELLLNPGLSEPELQKQISEPGTVHSGEVEITPQMKAEMFSPDEEAFSIRPVHDAPVQVISGVETTKWSWYVTAKKEGTQKLTIVIYRLIKYDNREFWREVETYKSDIHIRVTLGGRINSLGWGWIAGIVIVLAAVPAFWRWYVQSRNKPAQKAGLRVLPGKEGSGHIFISYRRSDSADITGRIYDRLVDEFGRNVIFKDVDSIPLGIDFREYLDQQISECNVLLAMIGDRWVDVRDPAGNRRLEDPDDFVRVEIESALEQGIPVIPLLVHGAQMPVEESVPFSLRKLLYKNGIPIRPDPDFHRDMDRLITALDQYIR